jgi:hypothetical protein
MSAQAQARVSFTLLFYFRLHPRSRSQFWTLQREAAVRSRSSRANIARACTSKAVEQMKS